ncbi:MAG TPA: glycoside hydrolase family 43 protein [Microbacterium sp.]|nr:glycoside hydrolase family 43 protein [Microbacterium sp.]
MTDTAYLFVYFTGETGPDDEAIRFAVTAGDDPLADWIELGDGQPLFVSSLGERGLRDPHLVRHPREDRWFLIATDLRIQGRPDGFAAAQQTGSRDIMVWESADLVTWSEQRRLTVAPPEAGNAWAPEAVWDAEREEFFVFWASALYPADVAPVDRRIQDSYQRMFYATTTDFVTISEPQVWIDEPRGPGRGFIDSTIIRSGGGYYRFTKDEATMLPVLDRSGDLHAVAWERIAERIGHGQANPWGGTFTEGEGPTAFRSARDDCWYLFIDQPSYHGGAGYLAFRIADLDAGVLESVPAALPRSPRHGTVVPITAADRDRLVAAYAPEVPAHV